MSFAKAYHDSKDRLQVLSDAERHRPLPVRVSGTLALSSNKGVRKPYEWQGRGARPHLRLRECS